jgi:hypothetical protein
MLLGSIYFRDMCSNYPHFAKFDMAQQNNSFGL